MEKKNTGIVKRIAMIVLSAVMMLCVLAQPVFAAEGVADAVDKAEKHKHTYSEWETIREAGQFAEMGLRERVCEDCGKVQRLYVPSPLLGIVFAVLALIVIVGFVRLFIALAGKFKKFFKIFLLVLIGICLAILLIGAGAQCVLVKGTKFGPNLVQGLVELLGCKGFTAEKANDCIFMMFGKVPCMVINGLFYVSLITLIFVIIALVKAAITGVKKGAEAVGKAVTDTTDKLLGKND